MPKTSAVGKLASTRTKKEFGDELSRHTMLTAKEIQNLFPNKSNREELMELIEIVNSDASDKDQKVELTKKIDKVSGAVIAIGKKFLAGLSVVPSAI